MTVKSSWNLEASRTLIYTGYVQRQSLWCLKILLPNEDIRGSRKVGGSPTVRVNVGHGQGLVRLCWVRSTRRHSMQ